MICDHTAAMSSELLLRTLKYRESAFNTCLRCEGSSCKMKSWPKEKKGDEQHIFGGDFPSVTIKDMVSAQVKLLDALKIDKLFIHKLPRIILSVISMALVLFFMLGIFDGRFEYNENWKFIYLFIIIIPGLISYFLISNISGAFKFKDIKLK